jgi:hypothetical protein
MRLDLCSWPHTARHRLETSVTSCEVCGAQSGAGAGLSLLFFYFPPNHSLFRRYVIVIQHCQLSCVINLTRENTVTFLIVKLRRSLISHRKMVSYFTRSWTAIIWLIKFSHKSKQWGHLCSGHLKTTFCTESGLLVSCQDIYLHVHSPGVIRWQPEIVWRGHWGRQECVSR